MKNPSIEFIKIILTIVGSAIVPLFIMPWVCYWFGRYFKYCERKQEEMNTQADIKKEIEMLIKKGDK